MVEPGDFVQCIDDSPVEFNNEFSPCPLVKNRIYEVEEVYHPGGPFPMISQGGLLKGSHFNITLDGVFLGVGVLIPQFGIDLWHLERFRPLHKLKPDPQALSRLLNPDPVRKMEDA